MNNRRDLILHFNKKKEGLRSTLFFCAPAFRSYIRNALSLLMIQSLIRIPVKSWTNSITNQTQTIPVIDPSGLRSIPKCSKIRLKPVTIVIAIAALRWARTAYITLVEQSQKDFMKRNLRLPFWTSFSLPFLELRELDILSGNWLGIFVSSPTKGAISFAGGPFFFQIRLFFLLTLIFLLTFGLSLNYRRLYESEVKKIKARKKS